MLCVSGQAFEGGTAINDRVIEFSGIRHDKRAREIDRSDIDLWVRSIGYSVLFHGAIKQISAVYSLGELGGGTHNK